jgi:hypothetical protein
VDRERMMREERSVKMEGLGEECEEGGDGRGE